MTTRRKIVELEDRHAMVNAQGERDFTVLKLAVQEGDHDFVWALVPWAMAQHGTDQHDSTHIGLSCLHISAERVAIDLIDLLVAHDDDLGAAKNAGGLTPLHDATLASLEHSDARLRDAGLPPDMPTTTRGWTLLHVAARLPGSSHAGMPDLEGGEVEARYKSMYDEKMNPFQQFNKSESQQRYTNLNTVGQILLNSAKIFLDHRITRNFAFGYILLLHFLVFSTLYTSCTAARSATTTETRDT